MTKRAKSKAGSIAEVETYRHKEAKRKNVPLLDIKPYFASTDSVPEASVGWHAERRR